MSQQAHPDRMAGLMVAAGVLFALIFTLIFLMVEQAINGLKTRRIKPGVPDLLDNRVPRRRVLGNSRLRIGK